MRSGQTARPRTDPHRDSADAFDVGAVGHQPHQVRDAVERVRSVLDADDAPGGGTPREGRVANSVVSPAPVPPEMRNASLAMISRRSAAVHPAMAPDAVSAARSCARGLAQRQAGTAGRRWRHGGGARVTAPTGELAVDRMVGPRRGGGRQQRERRCTAGAPRPVRETNSAASQVGTVVHPHRVWRGDQHVGGAVRTAQRFEDPAPVTRSAAREGCRALRYRRAGRWIQFTALPRRRPDSAAHLRPRAVPARADQ